VKEISGGVELFLSNLSGPRVYIGSKSELTYFKLLGQKLTYTIDLSQVYCGFNAAVYLTSFTDGKVSDGTATGYCDANGIGGTTSCSEFDIMEANVVASHMTAHKCTAPGQCDASGILATPNMNVTQFDTTKPITISTSFGKSDSDNTVQTWKQGSKSVTTTVPMSGMGSAFEQGMVMVISFWAAGGVGGMSWLNGQCQTPPDNLSGSVKLTDFSLN